ncbi:MAG: hypothetical protein HYZ29_07920 [Myxococcales bacterium]|nr:hypothetical protein [Myxococcales bacterium]
MALERFRDPFVQNDVGPDYGSYVCSYASEHHLVEAHLFERNGKIVVYVTKSSGVPVAEAQRVAEEAVVQHQVGQSANPEFVYDGYSLGRSGSL